jgi:hypothetical protein
VFEQAAVGKHLPQGKQDLVGRRTESCINQSAIGDDTPEQQNEPGHQAARAQPQRLGNFPARGQGLRQGRLAFCHVNYPLMKE